MTKNGVNTKVIIDCKNLKVDYVFFAKMKGELVSYNEEEVMDIDWVDIDKMHDFVIKKQQKVFFY